MESECNEDGCHIITTGSCRQVRSHQLVQQSFHNRLVVLTFLELFPDAVGYFLVALCVTMMLYFLVVPIFIPNAVAPEKNKFVRLVASVEHSHLRYTNH